MFTPRAAAQRSLSARSTVALLLATVLAPIVYMLGRGLLASRNVAYGDDIDGTLMLLIRLHGGWDWSDLARWLLEVSNEHRMVTSRLLVAVSYWLTGTVNFDFMGVMGNLFVLALCALLIGTAGTTARRWSMALLLAGFVFQLEHYENFFWSGASIDHFQVPLLAAGAIVLLARGGWPAAAGAAMLAMMATLTLAHGLLVWPVGALLLAADRRWRQTVAWCAVAVATWIAYFSTFRFNPAHQIDPRAVLSAHEAGRIVRYWLELMGAPLALGVRSLALGLGAGLVALLGWQIRSIGLRRERIALPLALWAIGSLGLVAVGRANLGEGVLDSRYYILGALAWVLVLQLGLQRWCDETRPFRFARWLVPALVVFNVAADVRFSGAASRWIADRDLAANSFMQQGRDGVAVATLHPLPAHATRVIRAAEELGVFEMPRQSLEIEVPGVRAGVGLASSVDRVAADDTMVMIDGWAAIPGRESRPGEVHVVLVADGGRRVLTTLAVSRPDVAAAYPNEQWRDAGFHFELRRWLVPRENYQIGLLIPTGHGAEFVLTDRRLNLDDTSVAIEKDKVAPDRIVYDELVLLQPTASVTAAPNKPVRVSFLDLRGNLVHVDFSGAGTMTVNLAGARLLEPPLRDHGRRVACIEGNAAIAIAGADETSNLAVYSPRRQPVRVRGAGAAWLRNGLAHIASVSIASSDGRFGGLRTGNAWYRGSQGFVGVLAPDVHFHGPVVVGNIVAAGSGMPALQLGSASDVRIAGGGLRQANDRPVLVSGFSWLHFVAGRTARGIELPARMNQATLMENGADVTRRLVRDSLPPSASLAALQTGEPEADIGNGR